MLPRATLRIGRPDRDRLAGGAAQRPAAHATARPSGAAGLDWRHPFELALAARVRRAPVPTAALDRHLTALEAVGWRVVELRPMLACGAPALWRAAITRVDLDASMTVSATDPDAALAELVRYASADATAPR